MSTAGDWIPVELANRVFGESVRKACAGIGAEAKGRIEDLRGKLVEGDELSAADRRLLGALRSAVHGPQMRSLLAWGRIPRKAAETMGFGEERIRKLYGEGEDIEPTGRLRVEWLEEIPQAVRKDEAAWAEEQDGSAVYRVGQAEVEVPHESWTRERPMLPGMRIAVEAARRGGLIVLTGAGVSRDSGLPGYEELACEAEERFGMEHEEGLRPGVRMDRVADKEGHEVLVQWIEDTLTKREGAPSPAHRAVAELSEAGQAALVATTNWDRRQEKCLPGKQVKHLHGTLGEGNLLLGEKDLREEYRKPVQAEKAREVLEAGVVLCVGYAMRDEQVRLVIDRLNEQRRREGRRSLRVVRICEDHDVEPQVGEALITYREGRYERVPALLREIRARAGSRIAPEAQAGTKALAQRIASEENASAVKALLTRGGTECEAWLAEADPQAWRSVLAEVLEDVLCGNAGAIGDEDRVREWIGTEPHLGGVERMLEARHTTGRPFNAATRRWLLEAAQGGKVFHQVRRTSFEILLEDCTEAEDRNELDLLGLAKLARKVDEKWDQGALADVLTRSLQARTQLVREDDEYRSKAALRWGGWGLTYLWDEHGEEGIEAQPGRIFAAAAETLEKREKEDRYCWIGRKRIGDGGSTQRGAEREPGDVLTDAARDALEALRKNGPEGSWKSALVQALRSRSLLLRRVGIEGAMAGMEEAGQETLAVKCVEEGWLAERALRREGWRLAGKLTEGEAREKIREYVLEGVEEPGEVRERYDLAAWLAHEWGGDEKLEAHVRSIEATELGRAWRPKTEEELWGEVWVREAVPAARWTTEQILEGWRKEERSYVESLLSPPPEGDLSDWIDRGEWENEYENARVLAEALRQCDGLRRALGAKMGEPGTDPNHWAWWACAEAWKRRDGKLRLARLMGKASERGAWGLANGWRAGEGTENWDATYELAEACAKRGDLLPGRPHGWMSLVANSPLGMLVETLVEKAIGGREKASHLARLRGLAREWRRAAGVVWCALAAKLDKLDEETATEALARTKQDERLHEAVWEGIAYSGWVSREGGEMLREGLHEALQTEAVGVVTNGGSDRDMAADMWGWHRMRASMNGEPTRPWGVCKLPERRRTRVFREICRLARDLDRKGWPDVWGKLAKPMVEELPTLTRGEAASLTEILDLVPKNEQHLVAERIEEAVAAHRGHDGAEEVVPHSLGRAERVSPEAAGRVAAIWWWEGRNRMMQKYRWWWGLKQTLKAIRDAGWENEQMLRVLKEMEESGVP